MKFVADGLSGEPSALDKLCDRVCFCFAAWTLLCESCVAVGVNLRQLLVLTCVIAIAAGGAVASRLWSLRRSLADSGSTPVRAPGTAAKQYAAAPSIVVGLLVLAAVVASRYGKSDDVRVFWFCTVAWLLAAAGLTTPWRSSDGPASPGAGRRLVVGLSALSLLCVGVALLAHRPDADDSLYLSISAWVADHPTLPLLSRDTLHGLSSQILLPTYRVQSIDTLVGAVAFLTGIEPIWISHIGVAAVAAALMPLTLGRLFRVLAPQGWIIGVTGVLTIYLLTGETHRWYSNFALTRLHQGKSIALSVVLPLVIAYSLELARRPSLGALLLVAAAGVAAVGLSATFLWVVPVVVVLACLCHGSRPRELLRNVALGSLGSMHPLLLGLAFRAAATEATSVFVPIISSGRQLVMDALREVLGAGRFPWATLLLLLASAVLPAVELVRRVALVLSLAFFVFLLNPYLAQWVARNVTSYVYWRVFWVLPVPVLIASLILPRTGAGFEFRSWVGLALFLSFVLFAPTVRPLSRANGTLMHAPGLKTDFQYEMAMSLDVVAGPDAAVLAPESVAAWVVTKRHHANPLVVRRLYSDILRKDLGDLEVDRRESLMHYVAGEARRDSSAADLRESIVKDRLRGVVVSGSPWISEVRTVLSAQGFRLVSSGAAGELWATPRRSPQVQ